MPMGVALPGNNYLFQVNKNVRKRCETGSKLKKSPERRQWCRSSVIIVNFEHYFNFFLMFLLLNLNK